MRTARTKEKNAGRKGTKRHASQQKSASTVDMCVRKYASVTNAAVNKKSRPENIKSFYFDDAVIVSPYFLQPIKGKAEIGRWIDEFIPHSRGTTLRYPSFHSYAIRRSEVLVRGRYEQSGGTTEISRKKVHRQGCFLQIWCEDKDREWKLAFHSWSVC